MKLDLRQTANMLADSKDVLILVHKSPDGDCLGSGYGLYHCLKQLGIRSRVFCDDEIPQYLKFLLRGYKEEDFEPKMIVAVDVAAPHLIGEEGVAKQYAEKVDLCIDHHPSNPGYAKATYLRADAAANAQNMYALAVEMGVKPDPAIANCFFTGLVTDTGCFKYEATSPETLRAGADLIEWGAESAEICRRIFDTRTKAQFAIESKLIDSLQFFHGGKVAIGTVLRRDMEETGAGKSDVESLAAIPRQVEGVEVGFVLKETEDGSFKISVRTSTYVNASVLAAQFGGGGHVRASGCKLEMPQAEAIDALQKAAGEML